MTPERLAQREGELLARVEADPDRHIMVTGRDSLGFFTVMHRGAPLVPKPIAGASAMLSYVAPNGLQDSQPVGWYYIATAFDEIAAHPGADVRETPPDYLRSI